MSYSILQRTTNNRFDKHFKWNIWFLKNVIRYEPFRTSRPTGTAVRRWLQISQLTDRFGRQSRVRFPQITRFWYTKGNRPLPNSEHLDDVNRQRLRVGDGQFSRASETKRRSILRTPFAQRSHVLHVCGADRRYRRLLHISLHIKENWLSKCNIFNGIPTDGNLFYSYR